MLNILIWCCLKVFLKILGWRLTSSADPATATGWSLRVVCCQVTISPSSFLFSGALGTHFQIKLGSLLCFCLYPSAQKGWMGHCWEGKSLAKGMICLRTLACVHSSCLGVTTFLTWGQCSQRICTLYPGAPKLSCKYFLCLRFMQLILVPIRYFSSSP